MNKKEVFKLIDEITELYPNFIDMSDAEAVTKRIDAWHRVLKAYDINSVLDNLSKYALENGYAPKINDLVKGLVVYDSDNVPGLEETKEILNRYKPGETLTKDQARELIRKKLGDEFLND
jgi:Loader and inhibitor of phage G40P